MIPLPDDITMRDVRQWLGSGYFYALLDEGKTVCYLSHEYSERASGENSQRIARDVAVVAVYDSDGRRIFTEDGDARTVKVPASILRCHWPKCGSVNILENKLAVHTFRPPHRGWTRTYDQRRVDMKMPGRWYMRNGPRNELPRYPGHKDKTHALFFPIYPESAQEAVEQWIGESGWKSVALNDHTIIVPGGETGYTRVYHEGVLVGKLDRNYEFVPFQDSTNKYSKDRIDKGLNV